MPGPWWRIVISGDGQRPYSSPCFYASTGTPIRPYPCIKDTDIKKVHQNKDYDQYIKQYLLGNVPLWSPSYFIATTGGATLEKVKEYVESQRTDDHKRKYQKTGRYRKQRKK